MKDFSTNKVIEVVNSILENSNLSEQQLDEDLTMQGMTSMAFIKIIVTLEEEFDCEIPDSKLLIQEMNSIKKILTVLGEIKETLYNF